MEIGNGNGNENGIRKKLRAHRRVIDGMTPIPCADEVLTNYSTSKSKSKQTNKENLHRYVMCLALMKLIHMQISFNT